MAGRQHRHHKNGPKPAIVSVDPGFAGDAVEFSTAKSARTEGSFAVGA
jgi:hypothetical protein